MAPPPPQGPAPPPMSPPPPPPPGPAPPPPVLPYDPHAKACYDCEHPALLIHVITHECLGGDALRCVIKAVPDNVPLKLDDYIRAGDLLRYIETGNLPPPPPPPPPKGSPPPPPPPKSNTPPPPPKTTPPPPPKDTPPPPPKDTPPPKPSPLKLFADSPESVETTKTIVSPAAPSLGLNYIVVTATPQSGSPFVTTIPVPAYAAVRRPLGGWTFESSSPVAPADGQPSEIVFAGPSGIFKPSLPSSSSTIAKPAIATDAVARLLDGAYFTSDHGYERDDAPGRLAPRNNVGRKRDAKIARVSLRDDQTLNPNARLLRKLREHHLLPVEDEERTEELEKRGAVVGSGMREAGGLLVGRGEEVDGGLAVGLFVVVVLLLSVSVLGGLVWFFKRRKAGRAATSRG